MYRLITGVMSEELSSRLDEVFSYYFKKCISFADIKVFVNGEIVCSSRKINHFQTSSIAFAYRQLFARTPTQPSCLDS